MKDEIAKLKRDLVALKNACDVVDKRLKHLEDIASGANIVHPDWSKANQPDPV